MRQHNGHHNGSKSKASAEIIRKISDTRQLKADTIFVMYLFTQKCNAFAREAQTKTKTQVLEELTFHFDLDVEQSYSLDDGKALLLLTTSEKRKL